MGVLPRSTLSWCNTPVITAAIVKGRYSSGGQFFGKTSGIENICVAVSSVTVSSESRCFTNNTTPSTIATIEVSDCGETAFVSRPECTANVNVGPLSSRIEPLTVSWLCKHPDSRGTTSTASISSVFTKHSKHRSAGPVHCREWLAIRQFGREIPKSLLGGCVDRSFLFGFGARLHRANELA
jgi:hypothetical protein